MISLNDLFSPMNPLILFLLRSPLHAIASKGLMIVSWSGRKSGALFSIPVGYQRDGDAIIVLISKPDQKSWWKNFRTPWPAELLIKGRIRTAMGEWQEPGSAEFFGPLEVTLRRLPWMGGQLGGIRYDRKIGLTDDQRNILCKKAGVIRFEPIA
jgi:hypothetical protein